MFAIPTSGDHRAGLTTTACAPGAPTTLRSPQQKSILEATRSRGLPAARGEAVSLASPDVSGVMRFDSPVEDECPHMFFEDL